ncbi:MAG: helix-turn-helix transcriptional regulator [Solobacterium sp.]|nr:helix-turn-helix transcriptional regulator [Solobacterium sp.]
MDIGKRVKQLRTKNDLTLEELASRCELTKGYLSQLERNLASPSIQTLEDIVEALGTTMPKFFAEEEVEQIVFTKADEFIDTQENQTIHWIVPNAQKNQMEPVIVDIAPKQKSMVISPHDGEEFGYVLSGKLYLCSDRNSKGLLIKKGETFYAHGNESHYLENRTDKTASVLWISTPPIF